MSWRSAESRHAEERSSLPAALPRAGGRRSGRQRLRKSCNVRSIKGWQEEGASAQRKQQERQASSTRVSGGSEDKRRRRDAVGGRLQLGVVRVMAI